MITIRKSQDRGHFDRGWINTYHTFSFDEYYDLKHMGFRTLRVINEDRIAPTKGFPLHFHHDMEVISYVVEGELAHKDNFGNSYILRPGMVGRMSAGSGISHSEYNHSETDMLHLLQIWIIPERKGGNPNYEEKSFSKDEKQGRLCLIASWEGHDNSLKINQNANVYASILYPENKITFEHDPHRFLWIQVIRGDIDVNGKTLEQGDGASICGEGIIEISTQKEAEFLLFDLS